MMTSVKSILLLIVVVACAGGYLIAWKDRSELQRVRAEKAAVEANLATAEANLTAARNAVRIEHQVQVKTRTVYLKAREAANHVQSIDPQCAQGDALVADFRGQLDRLRNPAAGAVPGDPAAS